MSDPGLRADVSASTGQLEAYRAGSDKGTAILVEAAEKIEADDPARATRLFTYATNVAVFAADIDRAVDLALRAVGCGERAGGLSTVSGAMARMQAGLPAGDGSVVATLEPLEQPAGALIESDLGDAEHVFILVVFANFVLERWERADRLLDVMMRRWHDRLDAPFERARTLLCLGERRLGPDDPEPSARGPVQEALATFASLGAQPWVTQALSRGSPRRAASSATSGHLSSRPC